MVSFHTPLSPTRRKMIPEFENTSKKRNWEESQAEGMSQNPTRGKIMKSIFDADKRPGTPLPLEWQRCLDIESGQIYFFNTRTQTRTSRDPRTSPEPPSPSHMSLDLELNLPCGSIGKNHVGDNFTKHGSGSVSNISSHDQVANSTSDTKKMDGSGLKRSPSWLTFEGDNQEMVTAVCKKCHMLVMMFKSSPACPNCKFMHPPDETPPSLFNRKSEPLMLRIA
ncbi:hypothetical protein RJ640_006627 [Escallonia rubra]|uniref:WW domain-containing protein n=1 Tax=Escallonia rubra TaxID=112253 RepID=A0AA88UH17_9ASTE|nr:hypothetical protein RJ640_006627 [Escallonia rubra]